MSGTVSLDEQLFLSFMPRGADWAVNVTIGGACSLNIQEGIEETTLTCGESYGTIKPKQDSKIFSTDSDDWRDLFIAVDERSDDDSGDLFLTLRSLGFPSYLTLFNISLQQYPPQMQWSVSGDVDLTLNCPNKSKSVVCCVN